MTGPARRNDLLPVEYGGDQYQFKYEPRCRVCNAGPEMVALVNKLLLNGETYTETYRFAVQFDQRKKPFGFQSVYKHGTLHMPSSSMAVRRTIEKRSKRLGQDFIEGTDNLLSEVTYAEVMMRKAFELIAGGAEVSPKDGLEAAKALRQFTSDDDESGSLAGVLTQLNEIIEAVRAEVPPEMYQRIVARLETPVEQPMLVASETVDDEDDDEPFDPQEMDLDRDDLE